MLRHQNPEERAKRDIIMDCGMGNSRRFISVTNIVNNLENTKCGLAEQCLVITHLITGCDFTTVSIG